MPDVARSVAGRYEIVRELGRSGTSTVHLAWQTDLQRRVALRELHAIGLPDPSALSHPNIVTVLDCFERDGATFVAMEYVERGSLRGFVGRLTLAQIGGVLEGLLAGLRHAEQRGIVHRDLRPENVMVTADGRVKIADFGLAKATAPTSLTVTGVTVGTTAYMAPEQATGGEIGPWTDLYSVGCIAFELCTGQRPFAGSEAPMATLLRHVNEPIPPVKSLVPDIDAELSDWIGRLLVKEPAGRPRRAGDAWAALEEILVRLLGPLWRRQAPLARTRPARARRRWAMSAALGTGIAVVAGVGASALGTDARVPSASAPPKTVVQHPRGTVDPAFIRGVGRVLGWLETRERPISAQLRVATTRKSRVALTKRLWWTYAGASKRLRRLDAGPAESTVRRQLAEALRLAGCAYGRAAGRRDRAGYTREGELALVHQTGVQRALTALRDAGYELPPDAAGAARFTRLPPLGTA